MLKKLLLPLIIIGCVQAKDVVDTSEYCSVNWSSGKILCSGESDGGQKKFRAKRAAVIIAQRNLLELIKGVQIDSLTTVENGMLKSDIIRSSVNGMIKGCEVVSNKFNASDKSSLATVKISMGKDLREALLSDGGQVSWNDRIKSIFSIFMPTELNAKEIYTHQDKTTIQKLMKDFKADGDKENLKYFTNILKEIDSSSVTGLLIDARGIASFEPAMTIKLVDKNGKEIYPGKYVTSKQFVGKNGVSVGLDFDIADAKANKRVFDTPLEIKSASIYKKRKSDIVLSDKDIQRLNLVADSLRLAKVIVVVPE